MRSDVLFFDVDTQRDFMDEQGALAVPGAAAIRPNLRRLAQAARRLGIPVIASEDAHDPDDPEFADFPPHCVKGTPGARKIEETSREDALRVPVSGELPAPPREALARGMVVLEKKTLDVFTNPAAEKLLAALPGARVVLYGVATEYCVKAAAEGLLRRGRRLEVVTDAVKGVDEEAHRQTLAGLAAAGARLLTTGEVLAGLGPED